MSKIIVPGLLACAIVVAGCSARTAPLRSDVLHPAGAGAPEAPVAAIIRLEPDAFDKAVAEAPVENPADSTMMSPIEDHVMPSHHRPTPGMSGTGAARSPRSHSTSTRPRSPGTPRYACPMHPEVTDVRASRCPKCGMALVLRKEKP